MKTVVFKYI